MLYVSVGHEGHLPFGRSWYLPGERSGLAFLGPEEAARPLVKISSSFLLRFHCNRATARGCTLGHSVSGGTYQLRLIPLILLAGAALCSALMMLLRYTIRSV